MPTWLAIGSGNIWQAGGDAMAGSLVRNTITRGPGDNSAVIMDFGDCPELIAGDTLASVTVAEGTATLTIGTPVIVNGYQAKVTITGGVDGATYQVRWVATTTGGLHIDRTAIYAVAT